jgi:hypothetical protein
MANREILDRIDGHMKRGNELMEEVREEHRLNRIFYEHQLDLTRTVVQRNGEAFVGMMTALERLGDTLDSAFEAFGERIEAFGERIDAFGATLDLQREILLRFLDRLDDGGLPQG